MSTPVKFFSGNSSQALATKIADIAMVQPLGKMSILRFSDGEFEPYYEETVRGSSVYLIQSTNPPIDYFFELLLMADAAKESFCQASYCGNALLWFCNVRTERISPELLLEPN